MSLINIDSVNSSEEGYEFWTIEYGKPDILSKPEDITAVMDTLLYYEDELRSLETEISRRNGDLPQYKLNRAIVLHFIVEAAEKYLEILNSVVYDTMYEKEIEKLDSIEKTLQHPWEN